jgi:hypothetical protein
MLHDSYLAVFQKHYELKLLKCMKASYLTRAYACYFLFFPRNIHHLVLMFAVDLNYFAVFARYHFYVSI